ncbi:MAG: efflux transporter outer membrane subunit [Candidatus Tectimicrobiota bacterium]
MTCLWSVLLLSLTVGLASCTVGPTYQPPTPHLPATWSAAQAAEISTEAATLAQWWSSFDDPSLTALMTRAMHANHDLRLAVARVREVRATRGVVAADRQAQVQTSAAYSRNRRSTNALALPANLPTDSVERENDVFQVGFDARWELDLFGAVRRSIEAAEADIAAATAAQAGVLVSLAGEVARQYLELRGAQTQLAITRKNLTAQQDTLGLTQVRLQAGLSTDLDVARAEAQVATTAAQIPSLERQITQGMHRLSVLLGQEPEALGSALSPPAPVPPPPPRLFVGLPVALLERRPDLRQAERALAAATARVGAATAELYPRLSLTGMLGLQSFQLTDLAQPGSQVWSLGPAIRWPLFDAGRIRATIQVQDARQEQALIRYEQAVLNALEEVENALVAYSTEVQRHHTLGLAVESNRRAVSLANTLYTRGLADFLNVLQAESALFTVENQYILSHTALSTSVVALYKALGGGWEVQ